MAATDQMPKMIDQHLPSGRHPYMMEWQWRRPICRVLGIAPSTYYEYKAVERDPDRASARARRDGVDEDAIKRVFEASRGRYGARKVWHVLRREGRDIARAGGSGWF